MKKTIPPVNPLEDAAQSCPNRPLPPPPSPEDAQRQADMMAAAAAAGAAAAGEAIAHEEHRRRRHRHRHLRRKLIAILALLVVLVVAAMVLWPKIRAGRTMDLSGIEAPTSLTELLPDEEMGYNTFDFAGAILGESQEQRKLIVLKQEVCTTNRVTQALANIALFAKTKVIRSYGTGQYTVDLMDLSPDDIAVDETLCLVTVTIPHTVLDEVIFDVTKTEFEDTEKNWLAFGEIKMTAEQQKMLEESVLEDMTATLSAPALLLKADERALYEVRQIYQPIVTALSADYIVKVVMADAPAATPTPSVESTAPAGQ